MENNDTRSKQSFEIDTGHRFGHFDAWMESILLINRMLTWILNIVRVYTVVAIAVDVFFLCQLCNFSFFFFSLNLSFSLPICRFVCLIVFLCVAFLLSLSPILGYFLPFHFGCDCVWAKRIDIKRPNQRSPLSCVLSG